VGDIKQIEISNPESIADYLMGSDSVCTEDADVTADGMWLCKIRDGQVTAIGCDHPRHGCHPKYREAYAKVRKILSKLRKELDTGPCPKCGGAGWLDNNTAEARHTMLMALTFGMWRGISFTPRGLQPGSAADTMDSLLADQSSAGASSAPVGMAAPAGAFLQVEGKGEGNGKDDG